MFRRNYSLLLMAVWLFIGVCLVFPGWVLPEKAQQQLRAPGGSAVGILAFVFAAYNLVRWWAVQSLYRNRRAARAVNPLAVRKLDEEPESERDVPNPDLDFLTPPDDEVSHPSREPSANGDHKV